MSTPEPGNGDAVTAALLQITQHAERLAGLDERQAGHYREIAGRLTELARQAADTSARVEGIHATAARQATILDALDGLDQQVAALAARLTSLTAARGSEEADERYRPAPVTQWWKLDGEERNEAISR